MSLNQLFGPLGVFQAQISSLESEHQLDNVFGRDLLGIVDVANSDEIQTTADTAVETELEETVGPDAVVAGAAVTVTIDFVEGWNIIGYPLPFEQDVSDTFADTIYNDKILLIKNNAARVYWPEFGFNGIGNWAPGQGYQVKTSEAFSFNFPLLGANAEINEQTTQNRQLLFHQKLMEASTDLLDGWNIIAYNRSTPRDVAEAWSAVANVSDLQIMKNNAAKVYWPEYSFNGIGDLIPGQGYQLKTYAAINDFRWPEDEFDESSLIG